MFSNTPTIINFSFTVFYVQSPYKLVIDYILSVPCSTRYKEVKTRFVKINLSFVKIILKIYFKVLRIEIHCFWIIKKSLYWYVYVVCIIMWSGVYMFAKISASTESILMWLNLFFSLFSFELFIYLYGQQGLWLQLYKTEILTKKNIIIYKIQIKNSS